MNDMGYNILDKKKIETIVYRIITAEVKNNKSKELSDSQMADKIIKIIQEEVECISSK